MSKEHTARAKEGPAGLFPMFLKLEGRVCLVVGAGVIAEAKIRSLLEAGARVRVIAPEANAFIRQWAQAGEITWDAREFKASDLEHAFLVIAATSSFHLNETIYQEARKRKVLCNAVDDPEHCDFYYRAVVRRGGLQIAISTAGQSPALAQRVRRELEEQFGPEYSRWVDELGDARRQLFAQEIDPGQRRQLLHQLASRDAFHASGERKGGRNAR